MSIEYRLIERQLLLDGSDLRTRRILRVRGRRQRPVAQETGHQEKPGLGRREIAARDRQADATGIHESTRVTSSRFHYGHSAECGDLQRFTHRVSDRTERCRALGHKPGEAAVAQIAIDARHQIRLVIGAARVLLR